MCNCIEEMNSKLAEFKAEINCTLFSVPQRACVEVYSTVDNRRGLKRPPKVLASYCPFCGEQYAEPKK